MNKKKAMPGNWLYIMLKTALCLGAFYLIYNLFLRKETHFALNRYYVLGAAVLSMTIPFITLGIHITHVSNSYTYFLDTISVGSRLVEDALPDDRTVRNLLMIVYSTGVVFLMLRLFIRVFRLVMIIRHHGCEVHNGLKLVFLPDGHGSPFSFFRYTFISREHFHSASASSILAHEKVHVAQHHSLDLILLECVAILQWFNPVAWFMIHSVKQLHEYIADEGVVSQLHDRATYQNVLLGISSEFAFNPLVHNFNHSLLKRRFIMMNRSKSLPHTRWKLATIIPVIGFMVLTFSDVSGNYLDQVLSWEQPGRAIIGPLASVGSSVEPARVTVLNPAGPPQSDSIFTRVEELPSFKGGPEELNKYITQNITYPEQARKQGIQGTVFITFLIDEKGKVSNGKVLRGIGNGCDEEALRVVMSMPDWNPGKNKGVPVKVQFNLPIKFNLSNDTQKDVGKDVKMDTEKDIDPK